jgi:N-acetylmuramoyl-L-alanine amidase
MGRAWIVGGVLVSAVVGVAVGAVVTVAERAAKTRRPGLEAWARGSVPSPVPARASASALGPGPTGELAGASAASGATTPARGAVGDASPSEAGGLRVMLDPGHGGSNTGCAAVAPGVYEKRVTLALAMLVAERLRARGYQVLMTRTDDRYATLRERVRAANRAGADLFVSLHANASPGKAQRGFETWVLTPEAATIDARAIRRGDGPERADVDAEAAGILDDVEQSAAQPWSVRLAERMQARLGEVWGTDRSRGVRQGAQDVLMGLTMPGVLVEVGFLDHAIEGAALLEHDVRVRLADAVVQAVDDWRLLRAEDPR